MRLFVDTEFTDLLECDLLSIGIVSEDGHEFYAESSDTDWTKSGDFARVAVLPKLRAPEANIFSETELSQRLRAWLASLAHGEQIVVSVDHPIDWEFFVYLARDPDTLEMPPHIKGQSIRGCVDPRDIEVYCCTTHAPSNMHSMQHVAGMRRAPRLAERNFADA